GAPEFDRVVESGAPLGIFTWVEAPPPSGELVVFERSVKVAAKEVPPAGELEAALAKQMEELNALRTQGADEDAIGEASYKARRLGIPVGLARRVAGRSRIEIPVQVMGVVEIAFLCAPIEIFAETGVAIKE